MTADRLARAAATTFSLMPPTGSTRPRRLISPVIAVSLRTVRLVNSETRAVNIVTPALGPAFGIAGGEPKRSRITRARRQKGNRHCCAIVVRFHNIIAVDGISAGEALLDAQGVRECGPARSN